MLEVCCDLRQHATVPKKGQCAGKATELRAACRSSRPHTAIGLIWNSMMSVAGGWFSLMVCEMFVLGNRDLRLPGLGSYLQTASNAGATRSIVWGWIVMVAVIVLIDQIVEPGSECLS